MLIAYCNFLVIASYQPTHATSDVSRLVVLAALYSQLILTYADVVC